MESGLNTELKETKKITLDALVEAFNQTNLPDKSFSGLLDEDEDKFHNNTSAFTTNLKDKGFDVSDVKAINGHHKNFESVQNDQGQVDETGIKILALKISFNVFKSEERSLEKFTQKCQQYNKTFQKQTIKLDDVNHKKIFDAFNAVKGKDAQVHTEGIKRLRREPTRWQSFCAAVGGIGKAGKIGKAKKNFQAEARKLMEGI